MSERSLSDVTVGSVVLVHWLYVDKVFPSIVIQITEHPKWVEYLCITNKIGFGSNRVHGTSTKYVTDVIVY